MKFILPCRLNQQDCTELYDGYDRMHQKRVGYWNLNHFHLPFTQAYLTLLIRCSSDVDLSHCMLLKFACSISQCWRLLHTVIIPCRRLGDNVHVDSISSHCPQRWMSADNILITFLNGHVIWKRWLGELHSCNTFASVTKHTEWLKIIQFSEVVYSFSSSVLNN